MRPGSRKWHCGGVLNHWARRPLAVHEFGPGMKQSAGAAIEFPLSGAKRKTFAILSFSGFDPVVGPKADRSPEQLVAVHILSTPFQDPDQCETMPCVVLTPGGDDETPRVHHAARRRGGGVAARGAGAAASTSSHRLSEQLRAK